MNILALLKRLEWLESDYEGAKYCAECGIGPEHPRPHKPDCQLKAAIDALEAGRLVLVAPVASMTVTSVLSGVLDASAPTPRMETLADAPLKHDYDGTYGTGD